MSAQVQTLPKKQNIANLFGFKVDTGSAIATHQPNGLPQFVPVDNPNYVFKRTHNFLSVFNLITGVKTRPIKLYGPKGAGKSSLPEEICGKLGKPIVKIDCGPKTSFEDIVGYRDLESQDATTFIDGPLLLAMQEGCPVIFEEIDAVDAAEMVKLNGVFQARPDGTHALILANDDNRLVVSKPGFCIFATGNTNGNGDDNLLYHGTKSQNGAVKDRFNYLEVVYPSKAVEFEVLHKSFGGFINDEILDNVIKAANMIRFVHVGTTEKSLAKVKKSLDMDDAAENLSQFGSALKSSDPARNNLGALQLGTLNTVLSTRVLLAFLDEFDVQCGYPGAMPIQHAAEETFINAAPEEEKPALITIMKLAFGDLWDMKTTLQDEAFEGMSQADFDAYLEEE